MILLEIAGNGHKKRAAPTSELTEEATITAMALSIRLLVVTTAILPSPTPTATMVLALLYI